GYRAAFARGGPLSGRIGGPEMALRGSATGAPDDPGTAGAQSHTRAAIRDPAPDDTRPQECSECDRLDAAAWADHEVGSQDLQGPRHAPGGRAPGPAAAGAGERGRASPP